MAEEQEPNTSGPSDSAEGAIIPQGEEPGGGPSASAEGIVMPDEEKPGDAAPQQDGIIMDD